MPTSTVKRAALTAALIEESLLRSKEGSRQLEYVATTIRSITESTGKVKALVDDVSLCSQEQARAMEQIAKAAAEMDKVTQVTAANAQESATAGEDLTKQAEALWLLVVTLCQMVHGDVESRDSGPSLGRQLEQA